MYNSRNKLKLNVLGNESKWWNNFVFSILNVNFGYVAAITDFLFIWSDWNIFTCKKCIVHYFIRFFFFVGMIVFIQFINIWSTNQRFWGIFYRILNVDFWFLLYIDLPISWLLRLPYLFIQCVYAWVAANKFKKDRKIKFEVVLILILCTRSCQKPFFCFDKYHM